MLTPINDQFARAEHEAVVVNDADPRGLMRVQVRVFGMMDAVPDSSLPWATYKLPVGARANSGDFHPAHIGDLVWVDFPYITHGQPDTRRPRITGSIHHCPDSVPDLPHESWAGPERLQHKRTGNEPVPALSGYHESRVITQHGITIEYERPGVYRITHRATGTALEITDQGDTVSHSENRAFHSSKQETEFEVGNRLTITVLQGNTEINVNAGDTTVNTSGNTTLETGGDMTLKAGGSINLDAGGPINNKAAAAFTVTAAQFTETLG